MTKWIAGSPEAVTGPLNTIHYWQCHVLDADHAADQSPLIAVAHGATADEALMRATRFAAAPDLYEALGQARNQVVAFALDSIGRDAAVEAVAYIDAALAKARGQEAADG